MRSKATCISIHAAREGGDLDDLRLAIRAAQISIHAAREGGDEDDRIYSMWELDISIHAAREGGDLRVRRFRRPQLQFQSTPPVKAATITQLPRIYRSKFQSTPPVKAATSQNSPPPLARDISIHAAREGGDRHSAPALHTPLHFNPRRP